MPLFALRELFDAIVMSLAIGFIFSDAFRKPVTSYDPLKQLSGRFSWNDLLYAASIAAPAVILHELAHKMVALGFGLSAVFQAAYLWLGIGVFLKLIGSAFIFFVPGFVSVQGSGSAMAHSLISVAGPLVNAVLWGGSWLALKQKWVSRKHIPYAIATRKINMFLFIFNMLPIPGFDGFSFYASVLSAMGVLS
ncbi:hypothetical protein J4475_02205 [Candidatus Woesearchaeota archaeon]|nr:hypothetical protein [Candidatus Woesearchaeota archaeon]